MHGLHVFVEHFAQLKVAQLVNIICLEVYMLNS